MAKRIKGIKNAGIVAVASIIEDEPADDTEYAREHVDRKALAEERERRLSLKDKKSDLFE